MERLFCAGKSHCAGGTSCFPVKEKGEDRQKEAISFQEEYRFFYLNK
jgi:hypothetical protein